MIREMCRLKNLYRAVLAALLIGGVCRLGVFFSVLLGLLVFFLMPGIDKSVKKEKSAYQRFLDVVLYLEQMESAYRKNGKIYQSLKETELLFREGAMKNCLQKAIYEIEREDATEGASKRALERIEQVYGCEQMELTHDFFLRNEMQGGEIERPVRILEKRRNAWISATEKCRSEKRSMLFSVLASLVLLFFVSEAMVFFLPQEMNVMTNSAERMAVVSEIGLLLLLARGAVRKNAADWLARGVERDVWKIEKDYLFLKNYDAQKEGITSLKWAVIPFALTLLLFIRTKSFFCLALGIPVTAVFVNQHKLDEILKKKRITKEVERDFPKWLLNIILLLDTESVQGAIFLSEKTAPNVLKEPLNHMTEELKENPTGGEPYFQFLEEFDVPRVHETMKLLYAISTGTGGNPEEQLYQIVEKNHEMTMQSEKIKNDNKVAGLMGYLFFPVFPAGLKMMLDLVLMMMMLYSDMGKMV